MLPLTREWNMYVYRDEPRFDPKTGDPDEPDRIIDHVRCDVSGAVIRRDHGTDGEPFFVLDYRTMDPCFGSSGDEAEFFERHELDRNLFLSGAYHLAYPGMNPEIEDRLAAAYSEMASGKWHLSLSGFLRSARITTADRLISEGVIEPEQLDSDGYGW
tara:strand:- start:112 stop:585 length:474 start_codon:yes stop_codon:yes gene_type:complete